ncbi:MAG: hypothetical protein C4296_13890 [Gemmataceae bacterium]
MVVGQRIGPFHIERELGSGAMGAVYLARYEKSDALVALKVITPALGNNPKVLARFEREAAILRKLRHPHIVRLLATGRHQRSPFYAMEYIEGESLDQVLRRRGRIPWEEVVRWGKQIASALHHAHANGVIHRDIKPSNIMITRQGDAKVTDFGIAKDLDDTALTSANCAVGTAAYMSPEQCRGERNLTARSDIYSLGVVFYELLTGRKPFQADNAMEMFLQHCQGTFERPSRLVMDIPAWLDTLVCQMLEKEPHKRPVDAAMVERALEEVQEKVEALRSAGLEAVAQKSKEDADAAYLRSLLQKTGKRPRKPSSGRKLALLAFKIAGTSALLLLIVGLLVYALWPRRDLQQDLKEAQRLIVDGLEVFKGGDEEKAKNLWYDARHRYLQPLVAEGADVAPRAEAWLKVLEVANFWDRVMKALSQGNAALEAEAAKSVEKARSAGLGKLLDQYPPALFAADPRAGDVAARLIEEVRQRAQPLEAPQLLREALAALQAAARSDEPLDEVELNRTRACARETLAVILRRYPQSPEAFRADVLLATEEARQMLARLKKDEPPPVVPENRAKELALEALYYEERGDSGRASGAWDELLRWADEPGTARRQREEYRPWIRLAESKRKRAEHPSSP